MEWVRVIWILNFFFFALILIFTWSKMAVISGKIKSITQLMEGLDELAPEQAEKPEEKVEGES